MALSEPVGKVQKEETTAQGGIPNHSLFWIECLNMKQGYNTWIKLHDCMFNQSTLLLLVT